MQCQGQFFSSDHRRPLGRYNKCGSDPALSTAVWLPSGIPRRCTYRSGFCYPFSSGSCGVIMSFWPCCLGASVCLFVCLSSFVLYCHASRSTPEFAFWAPLAMTVLTPASQGADIAPQLCILIPDLHVSTRATGEGFATLHRIFSELMRACTFVNRENEATSGVVWIFFFPLY